jgi:hypothetical protein
MNFRTGCSIFFIILIWWGMWELLGLLSTKLVNKKIFKYHQIYILSIIIGIFFIKYCKLDV